MDAYLCVRAYARFHDRISVCKVKIFDVVDWCGQQIHIASSEKRAMSGGERTVQVAHATGFWAVQLHTRPNLLRVRVFVRMCAGAKSTQMREDDTTDI